MTSAGSSSNSPSASSGMVANSPAVAGPICERSHSRAVGYPGASRLAAWASRPIIWLIYLYRITLAQFLASSFGGGCRYEPSCSQYAESALRKYGAWRGSIMAVKRVLRCHPWHNGGYDPVP